MDLAAIDEVGSISSLNEEIHEKNRIIERLEVRAAHALQRAAHAPPCEQVALLAEEGRK